MSNSRAFTLLELLLATVLSTVLMIGVLAVIADLGAPGSTETSMTALETDAIEAWVRLLREDLNHAGEIDVSRKNELTLTGYGALDARNCQRTHRPVRVTYKLEEIDGRQWLVRRQAAMDVLTNRNVQRDMVCTGVTRFELTPSAENDGASNLPGTDKRREKIDESDTEDAPAGATRNEPPSDQSHKATVDYRSFVPDTTGAHTRLDVQNKVMLNDDRWYVSEDTLTTGDSSASGQDTESEDANGTDTGGIGHDTTGPMVWQLRVWTGDQAEPTHDRVVAIQSNGGA